MRKFWKIFKAIILKRKVQPVDEYLKSFEIIEKLIRDGRIGIDFKTPFVEIDLYLHGKFYYDDEKYIAFMDKIRAYINFRRGYLKGSLENFGNNEVDADMLKPIDGTTPIAFAVRGLTRPILLAGYFTIQWIHYEEFNG